MVNGKRDIELFGDDALCQAAAKYPRFVNSVRVAHHAEEARIASEAEFQQTVLRDWQQNVLDGLDGYEIPPIDELFIHVPGDLSF